MSEIQSGGTIKTVTVRQESGQDDIHLVKIEADADAVHVAGNSVTGSKMSTYSVQSNGRSNTLETALKTSSSNLNLKDCMAMIINDLHNKVGIDSITDIGNESAYTAFMNKLNLFFKCFDITGSQADKNIVITFHQPGESIGGANEPLPIYFKNISFNQNGTAATSLDEEE